MNFSFIFNKLIFNENSKFVIMMEMVHDIRNRMMSK